MLKRLAIFAATALIVTVVLVARYDKMYDARGEGYDVQCKQSSQPAAAVATLACTVDHRQNTDQRKSNPPWWHEFFTWPEGITALLIMLTLGAIIWQAWETRVSARATEKAAEASLKQADIASKAILLQFRPKLRVRSISLEEAGEFFHVTIVIANRGSLPAYIHEGQIILSWLYERPSEEELKRTAIGSSTVQPWSQNSFGMSFRDDDLLRYKHYVKEAIKRPNNPLIRLRCEGTLSYSDDSGAYRYMGFSRIHDATTGQWITSTDTSREYHA